ncbi:hypothetical protein TWF730_003295 [Orbilia blumenaviensis]|uniref:DUF6594 domain-containing protein n=1 Tax=Orbilia blumenaviensis TaxID=1796055 RepID=A0AAV9U797_9PEZI
MYPQRTALAPVSSSDTQAVTATDLEKGASAEATPKPHALENIPLGYSYVAAYADGHEAAPVFRRFGALKARVLLTQQAVLESLEADLAKIDSDEKEDAEDPRNTGNMTWLGDDHEKRKLLVKKIAKKLRRYEKDLLLYRQVRHLPSAQKWQKRNFTELLNNKQPICGDEIEFLEKGDLISIVKESDDIAEMSEWVSDLRRKVFGDAGKWIFESSKHPVYQDSDEITIYSEKWMRIVSRTVFGVLVTAIVTSGVVLLYFVQVDKWRVMILCVSTLVCAVLTAVFTTAKKSEVFAVAAAYCAVLVVFVGTTLEKNSDVNLQNIGNWINGTISG